LCRSSSLSAAHNESGLPAGRAGDSPVRPLDTRIRFALPVPLGMSWGLVTASGGVVAKAAAEASGVLGVGGSAGVQVRGGGGGEPMRARLIAP